jgi:hypothetical protein
VTLNNLLASSPSLVNGSVDSSSSVIGSCERTVRRLWIAVMGRVCNDFDMLIFGKSYLPSSVPDCESLAYAQNQRNPDSDANCSQRAIYS